MLSVPGLDCDSYWRQLANGKIPEVECPSCDSSLLRGHGWYRRRVDGHEIRIRRLRCPRCLATHALLPEDLCAYRDSKLSALEEVALEGASKSLFFLLPATSGSLLDRVQAIVGLREPVVWLRHWLWSNCGYFFSGLSGLFRHGQPHRDLRGRSTNLWRPVMA